MSTNYFPCGICEQQLNDCNSDYKWCSKCGSHVCDYGCFDEQKEKYGLSKDPEDEKHYGGESLKECDLCSPSTRGQRIEELKRQIRNIENEE